MDPAQERLLLILGREDRPLTLREAASLAGIPAGEAAVALQGLCEGGSVRRLNTVIESYTATFL